MITSGAVYLIVQDFDRSVHFYQSLLQRDVSAQNANRFAIFNIDSLCLSIMNAYYDTENPEKVTRKGKVYSEYDDLLRIARLQNTGKAVINLVTDDLQKEHQRMCRLKIAEGLTDIRYINARNPYYYFSMKDPDGNTVEITGPYAETGAERL